MIYPDPEKLLNQWCELIARCRHRNKLKLLTNYLRKCLINQNIGLIWDLR